MPAWTPGSLFIGWRTAGEDADSAERVVHTVTVVRRSAARTRPLCATVPEQGLAPLDVLGYSACESSTRTMAHVRRSIRSPRHWWGGTTR